ncbi:MAG: portal protein, partial [Candidatus Hodarchaeales archaeon]
MSTLLFPYLSDSAYIKPDKFDKERYPSLGERYHLDFAKWALFNANETKHSLWLKNILRNKEFYKGNQWMEKEDIDSFLRDDTGNTRNRIKIVINQIRPMVEQYRGNAIRLAIGASAKAISKNAKVRREEALKKYLFMTDVANEFENIGEVMRSKNPELGDTPEETEEIFNNTYVDKYVKNINRLIEFSSKYNDMEEFQVKIAESMAFAGVGVIEEYKHGEHLRKEVVEPEEFFFDRNARRNDLQDAAYMGRVHMMTAPDIYERWQGITLEERKAIESYLSTESNVNNPYGTNESISNTGNSVPVYKTFFMDDMHKEAGYVEDEFGQPYLVYLNEEDKFSNGKVWKESDLIEPPETEDNKNLFKGKKKRKVVVGVLRYCIFIPGEAINFNVAKVNSKPEWRDIVMEYGTYDYQETSWMDL